MAGKYIEFVNPGYSTLYTRDLKYAASGASTRDASDPSNPFDPDSANPLLEGEWLEQNGINCTRLIADGSGVATAAAGKNIGQKPCFLHFSERGRYDAQITKKAHLVTGPVGYSFTTKLCIAGSSAGVGDKLIVCDVESPSASGKFVRGLASEADVDITSGGDLSAGDKYYVVGYITRKFADNHIEVLYQPSMEFVQS